MESKAMTDGRLDENVAEGRSHADSLFRQIVESIPVPVAVTTPEGEVEALNRPTLEYFGKTFEELKGWKSSDVVHPDDLQDTIAAQMAAHETGGTYNVESRHLRADGQYRWFNVLGLPLRDGQGNILRWFHLQIDIDDQKRAEEALLANERGLSEIINTIPALAWSARTDGSAEFFNQHYLEYLGLSADEAKDWGWTTAIHPEDLDRLSEDWRSIMASGKPGESEARLRRHDGKYRWFLFRANPLRDESGKVSKWYGVNTDIEDRKRGEIERKLAIDSLQANQGLLDLAQKSAGAMAFDWYIQEEINVWSSEQEALFGLAPGTFDGTYDTWKSMIYAPDWATAVVRAIQHAQQTGEVDAEYRVVWPDGSLHWLATKGRMFFDNEGKPFRMVGFTSDVTRRKLAEVRLSGEKHLLEMVASGRSLFDVLSELCTYVEGIATECHCSINLVDMNGPKIRRPIAPTMPSTYTDPLLDLPLYSDSGPCGMAAHQKKQVIVEDMENDPMWRSTEYRSLALDHGVRACWSTPIYSRAGNVLATFVILQDKPATPSALQQDLISQVTHIASIAIERAEAEGALKRSEAFLAEGQNLARIGNFSWRVDTGEIVWSDQLYRIFEFEIGTKITLELIGTRVHPDDMTLLYDMAERAGRGVSDYEYEHRLLMADGSVKHLHMMAHIAGSQPGRIEYIGAVQDVTQRRFSEEALNQARSELAHAARAMSLGVLTASIAHEVSQPLSGIITNASTCGRMLDADPPNIDGARETVRRTIRDGNRASEVIKRLRSLFGKKDFTAESVDLNEAAQEVIELTKSELRRSEVILQTEFARDLPAVNGDRVQLQQVILNLLLNAADAMSSVDDRPRQMTVQTGSDVNGLVNFSVTDQGVGFVSDEAEKLFDAFYTTKKSGMGIGLSVSRSIIEGHKGRLWAESNQGNGAVFSFSIPAADGPTALPASSVVLDKSRGSYDI
jgi:PAS domain S-box-containing protein